MPPWDTPTRHCPSWPFPRGHAMMAVCPPLLGMLVLATVPPQASRGQLRLLCGGAAVGWDENVKKSFCWVGCDSVGINHRLFITDFWRNRGRLLVFLRLSPPCEQHPVTFRQWLTSIGKILNTAVRDCGRLCSPSSCLSTDWSSSKM